MKIVKITKNEPDHTYGINTSTGVYTLGNGALVHNTSSQVSNATNGIEPPRGLVTTKGSKDGRYKQVVPDVEILGKQYEKVWDTHINKGYLTLVGIMQKFVDQTISANTNYRPDRYENNKVPLQEIIEDIFYAYHVGCKSLYYHNTHDGSGKELGLDEEVLVEEDDSCESGACKI